MARKKTPETTRTDKLVAAALNELRVTQGALSVLVEELTLMRGESILHRRALTELGVVMPELVNECRRLVRVTSDAERATWTLGGKLDNIRVPPPAEASVTIEHTVKHSCPTCERVDVYDSSGEMIDSTEWIGPSTETERDIGSGGAFDEQVAGELEDPPGQPVPPPRAEAA